LAIVSHIRVLHWPLLLLLLLLRRRLPLLRLGSDLGELLPLLRLVPGDGHLPRRIVTRFIGNREGNWNCSGAHRTYRGGTGEYAGVPQSQEND
jgi:hypothetical protein